MGPCPGGYQRGQPGRRQSSSAHWAHEPMVTLIEPLRRAIRTRLCPSSPNAEHVALVTGDKEKFRSWRQQNQKAELNLRNAKLDHLSFENVQFGPANLKDAEIATKPVALNRCRLEKCNFTRVDLDGAKFSSAKLSEAIFTGCNLRRADLDGAVLSGAHFRKADLYQAEVGGAYFDKAKGLPQAKNLHTVNLRGDRDVIGFETAEWKSFDRLDWARLRYIGSLPIFGFSSLLVFSLPPLTYLIDYYNDRLELVHAWARRALDNDSPQVREFATMLLERLGPLPISINLLLLFLATTFLWLGALTYSIACPERVQEVSEHRWCHELQKPLILYRAESWRRPPARLFCALFYLLAILFGLPYIAIKLYDTSMILMENLFLS